MNDQLFNFEINVAFILRSLRGCQEFGTALRIPRLPGLLPDPRQVRKGQARARAREGCIPGELLRADISVAQLMFGMRRIYLCRPAVFDASSNAAKMRVDTPPALSPLPKVPPTRN
jgi:hypothetical protein